jgi:hypothetical protein
MRMKRHPQYLISKSPRRGSRVGTTIGIDLGDVWSHLCAAIVRNLPARSAVHVHAPALRMRSYSVRLRSDCAVQEWELGRRPLWKRTGDGFSQ